MPDRVDDLVRLAIFEAWGRKCVWCGRPLFFNEMEVDHLIPKSLADEANATLRNETFGMHSLDSDYDLDALENMACSCRQCNGGKGAKPPPNTLGVSKLLQRARDRAPEIRTTAAKVGEDRQVERAATILREGAAAGRPRAVELLREAASTLEMSFERATGRHATRLHSALSQISDSAVFLSQSVDHFVYLATTGPTGGPANETARRMPPLFAADIGRQQPATVRIEPGDGRSRRRSGALECA